MALSGLLNDVVKLLAGRPRPTAGDAGSAPFTFDYAFQSFPSGHTAIAFALAFSLSLFWPRWRLPLLAFALAVAASRVIISAHYPADVIGGALVAWLTVAWLARFFADRRLVFQRDTEGRPVPRPAPDGSSRRRETWLASRVLPGWARRPSLRAPRSEDLDDDDHA